MFATLLKSWVTRKLYRTRENPSPKFLQHHLPLNQDQRQQLRQVLAEPGWAHLEDRLVADWVSSVTRLINAKDDSELVRRQAEVQTLERIIGLPARLLTVDKERE